ncbi:vWA domain-containing protein [Pseudohalioglobus lutimaris]|uniref:VWA domain-containing protein n=1 Tax=Pseudohalioglobus lutimaris TaxID=1737061 RepID=A0A2N5X8H2_9GAMM|nr:VWA domain-containing protein [Pseudohalioglobus lutimaris]PLW70768.1 VWA domain-containing protein [Pseudohalioglobus lutimaris]
MIELAYPWALLLLPLPLLMRLLPAYKESRDSVRVPFFAKLVELSKQRPEQGARVIRRDRAQKFLVNLTWLCLVLAAAKPQWIGPPIEQQKSGRDLMVAVDLSGSMETQDFALADGTNIDRLQAVKQVLEELADRRPSDRLGLIVFGAAAYLQTPFTDDHQVWMQLLDETEIGMAGPSTVFGDAIGLAIRQFTQSDSSNRVLIILTDGNDTGSTVPPIDAAKVAASYAVRIYTIAIGDPTTVGEDALDMDTITRVSEISGGRTFEALDQKQMRDAYLTIGELEPELYESISFRPKQSLHWLPVALACILYLLYHTIMALITRKTRAADNAA